jgi:hypothetical protein
LHGFEESRATIKTYKWYFDTLFFTQYIYRREKPKKKEEIKRKNIRKLFLCM